MSDVRTAVLGMKQLGFVLLALMLTACAGPSGVVPIDDRGRGGSAKSMQPVTSGTHRVQRGETLYQIAFRYGWDWKELARANNMREPYTIYPGQEISLRPPGRGQSRPPTVSSPRPPAVVVATPTPSRTPTTTARPAPAPAYGASRRASCVSILAWGGSPRGE